MLRNQASTLRLQDVHDLATLAAYNRMQQYHRDGHNKTEYRGHECLRDTAGHHLRIACTVQGNNLEGLDHTRNRSKQTHQRSDCRYHLDEQKSLREIRHLLERRFTELQFDRFGVSPTVTFVGSQYATKRIISACGFALELCLDLAVGRGQCQPAHDRDQQANDTEGNDAVTDD